MSYDVCLRIDTGGEYPVDVSGMRNPTFNLAPMFLEALGCTMRSLEGKTGAEALPIVHAALGAMELDPERFRKFDPPNGWGDYAGAVEFMRWFRDACRDHPKATVSV